MPIGGLILCEKAKQLNEQLHANEATTQLFTASFVLLCMVRCLTFLLNYSFVVLTKHLLIPLQVSEPNSAVDMLHWPQVSREDPVGVVYYVYVLEDTSRMLILFTPPQLT